MAVDQRERNAGWDTRTRDNHYQDPVQYQRASLAVLMDIRDELQTLNRLLDCTNFTRIPNVLDLIAKNMKAKRKYTKGQL